MMAASTAVAPALPAPIARSTPTSAPRRPFSRPASSPSPSYEQASAITSLLPFDDFIIIVMLTVIRSIEPSFECRPGAGHLTAQQLDALSSLSPSCDEDVKAWLGLGRRHSSSASSERLSQCSTLAESRFSRASSRASSIAAENLASLALASTPEDPFEPSDLDHNLVPHTSSNQSTEDGNLNFDKAIPPPLPRKDVYLHYATSGESDRPITSCDGFKRHEKEQTRFWVFIPSGPIEDSTQGPRCALCPTLHPDIGHLRFHDTQEYLDRKAPIKRSRRCDFEKVLREHNAFDEWIPKLVKEWCLDQPRKSYSCGFCIKHFETLKERNNHLCHSHFHRGQDMTGWHLTNLIRGLLLQEDVNKAYREMFGMDPSNVDRHRTWRTSSLKNLQYRLELGKEPPCELALAAYNVLGHTGTRISHGSLKTSETGTQFAPTAQCGLTSQNSMPPPLASAPTAMVLLPSGQSMQGVSNSCYHHHQAMKASGDHSVWSDSLPPQLDLVSAVNAPVRSDSLGHGLRPIPPAARFTGGSETVQSAYAGHGKSNQPADDMNGNTEAQAQWPLYCEFCSFPHLVGDACFEQPAMDDGVLDPASLPSNYFELEQTLDEAPPLQGFNTVKRKLSEESATAANHKAQTLSPMDLELVSTTIPRAGPDDF